MKRDRPAPAVEPAESIRLQSFLAKAGVGSRRGSEELIRERRVTVNGRTAEIGMSVDPTRDTVRVDRKIVSAKPPQWIALHKPRGYVTTRDDESGRKTVYDLLPDDLHHLFHVGRLDRDSSGLLLLTNDGETANRLLHPRFGTIKEYRADVLGRPASETLRELVEGVRLEDGIAQVSTVEMRGAVDDDVYRLILTMREGRNREVRRLLEAVGHPVHRLFRRSFGPIEIGNLRPGRWRFLTPQEIESLRPAERARKTGERPGGRGGSPAGIPVRGRPPPREGGDARGRERGGRPAASERESAHAKGTAKGGGARGRPAPERIDGPPTGTTVGAGGRGRPARGRLGDPAAPPTRRELRGGPARDANPRATGPGKGRPGGGRSGKPNAAGPEEEAPRRREDGGKGPTGRRSR